MTDIIRKEMKLSASVLSYFFIAFGLMFFFPGYPVLCGAFFVTLGIFQSFQNAVASNDIVFSALLPIAKKDVVKGKYEFSCVIELCGFSVMVIVTLIRMTLLSDFAIYRSNALMNANPFALAMALVIFGLFNVIFVGGFFKTAYKFGKPFVLYCITAFIVMGISEALHYFPGLSVLNSFGFDNIGLQLLFLLAGMACYALMTYISYRRACADFERIDL